MPHFFFICGAQQEFPTPSSNLSLHDQSLTLYQLSQLPQIWTCSSAPNDLKLPPLNGNLCDSIPSLNRSLPKVGDPFSRPHTTCAVHIADPSPPELQPQDSNRIAKLCPSWHFNTVLSWQGVQSLGISRLHVPLAHDPLLNQICHDPQPSASLGSVHLSPLLSSIWVT